MTRRPTPGAAHTVAGADAVSRILAKLVAAEIHSFRVTRLPEEEGQHEVWDIEADERGEVLIGAVADEHQY